MQQSEHWRHRYYGASEERSEVTRPLKEEPLPPMKIGHKSNRLSYNHNVDKSAENTFGFQPDDESWEIKTHASNRVLWKVSDFEGTGWLDDFEARFPDTDPAYTDPTQLKAFADWIVQTDRDAATDETLPSPVTYDGVTYSTDSADYRLAKFKAEVGDYVEIQSMLFYYLITDVFLMVDSRSKNMFPSFMGSEVIA